nr:immunoglobulin light chain junction region [Macaca mulatta]MOV35130.1 immunoglobulin light chain junction region [Macaca mulatta]
CQQRKTYPLTF